MRITYDPTADLKNWFRIKEHYPDNFTLTEFYPFDRSIKFERENFDDILKTIDSQGIMRFNAQALAIEAAWKKIEPKVLAAIFIYLGATFPVLDCKVNLTTAYRMPYDERDNWFMVPTHKPLAEQLRCLAHELFHLYHLKQNPSSAQPKREVAVQEFLKELKLP